LAVMAWSLVRDFLAGIIAGTQWFLWRILFLLFIGRFRKIPGEYHW
jgi:hypothetical protein